MARTKNGKNRRTLPAEFDRPWVSKLIPIAGFIVVCLGLAWFFESQATTTIIFVRHTDTNLAATSSNPRLNELGRQRAELLANIKICHQGPVRSDSVAGNLASRRARGVILASE